MAKYAKTIDLWTLTEEEIAKLQRGQWVCAGPMQSPLHRGIFCGVRNSGTVVVLWMGNAKGRDFKAYRKGLMAYGQYGYSPSTAIQ